MVPLDRLALEHCGAYHGEDGKGYHLLDDLELQEGEDILTLSTCAYHTDQGRFLVVARKI